jgi:hypothetical protein
MHRGSVEGPTSAPTHFALANKLARIVWAVLANDGCYAMPTTA